MCQNTEHAPHWSEQKIQNRTSHGQPTIRTVYIRYAFIQEKKAINRKNVSYTEAQNIHNNMNTHGKMQNYTSPTVRVDACVLLPLYKVVPLK